MYLFVYQGCTNVEITMKTASYGYENSWRIEFDSMGQVCTSDTGHDPQPHATYTNICILCKGRQFQLYCLDSYGDGWEFAYGDDAYVQIEGKKFCDTNFFSGYSLPAQSHTITTTCVHPSKLTSNGDCK